MRTAAAMILGAFLAVPAQAAPSSIDFDQGRFDVGALADALHGTAIGKTARPDAYRERAEDNKSCTHPAGPCIVNPRDRAWRVVESGTIAAGVDGRSAAAIPPEVTNMMRMVGWSRPAASQFSFAVKDAVGREAVSVDFLVARISGGSYEGRGKYLTGVMAVPARVEVRPGYDLAMEAEVTGVGNAGTCAEPVSALTLTVRWQIVSQTQTVRGSRVFYLQGDGLFREIGTAAPEALR